MNIQVNLLNGLAYDSKTFNLQGGTDTKLGEKKLEEDIKLLLTQEKGKFYPDPEFGSELQHYLFEPMTPMLGIQMQEEIKTLISKYYPQIRLFSIDVSLDPDTQGAYITITYNYSDASQELNTIDLALFNKVN